MTEFAHLLAFFALALSGLQAWFGLSGQAGAARASAHLGFALMLLSFALLVRAFMISDFSVTLVAENSHTLKPAIYKFAGTWGNHEGSMALWCLVTLGFGAAAATFIRTDRETLVSRAIGIQGILAAASLAYLLFASNPFLRDLSPPLQGADLNPLLQDPALAIHPPMLYLGYVGFSLVFSLAAAGLMERRIDSTWAKLARPWTMWAWIFLTIGIALGAYWAYYELGWGGWWFWDPVENASFMPWLIGTALVHSLIVTEKRGAFAAWTALLAVLAFCFSILGAFLVRSGVLTSVHAFAIDPARGLVLLGGLIVLGGAALALFALRADKLGKGPAFEWVSREGALLANNLVFAVATATVLLGTLFPLIVEALTGDQASVGPPYFNMTFSPMLALLLFALPVVQGWAWGRASREGLVRWGVALAALLLASIAFGMMLPRPDFSGVTLEERLTAPFGIGHAIGIGLGLWLVAGAAIELFRRALWQPGRVFRLPGRVWGMTLAHLGIGVFVIGAVVETGLRYERSIVLAPGEATEVAGWTLELDRMASVEGPNWYADRAFLTASRGDTSVEMAPDKRFYPAARMPTTETAIHKTLAGDLYIALGEVRASEDVTRWSFRVYFNPFIDWVFIGTILMSLGGGLSLLPRRRAAVTTRRAEAVAAE